MNAQGRMDLALLLYAALTLGRQTPLQTRQNTAAASPTPPRVPTPAIFRDSDEANDIGGAVSCP
jgi:hypothetical protein